MSIPWPLGVQVGVYPLGAAVRRGAKPHLTGISAHVCNFTFLPMMKTLACSCEAGTQVSWFSNLLIDYQVLRRRV